jgi:hypothetical protein
VASVCSLDIRTEIGICPVQPDISTLARRAAVRSGTSSSTDKSDPRPEQCAVAMSERALLVDLFDRERRTLRESRGILGRAPATIHNWTPH